MTPPSTTPPTPAATDAIAKAAGAAVVIGPGGIGSAVAHELQQQGRHGPIWCLGRRTEPALDYAREGSLAQSAAWVAQQCADAGVPLSLLVVATGYLHGAQGQPERSWSHLQADQLAHSFLINSIGPALIMKHFLPLLPRQGPCAAVFLSAKVGSIADNQLGGWYAYRAAKAALNQLVKTASIEQARRNREAAVVALHPGTVDTALSAPFSKQGLNVRSSQEAARQIVQVISTLDARYNGRFIDYQGQELPW
jgi:NAD(P)-dependent dehydrogenase (short-subunit alcohol dehydrogenase family)